MIRSLLSLMLAVAFAFQGMTGCAMAETGAPASSDHCAEMAASQADTASHHQRSDVDGPHGCKHNCHLPAIAAPPALAAYAPAAPEILAVAALASRHGGQTTPAIPPPRTA